MVVAISKSVLNHGKKRKKPEEIEEYEDDDEDEDMEEEGDFEEEAKGGQPFQHHDKSPFAS